MKDKWNKFTRNFSVKLISVIVLALFLIMVSIVLFEDVGLDNSILIYNIFGTISLIGFLYSYALTKKNIRVDFGMGVTRKQIYKSYLKNTLLVLFISLFLVAYYILIFKIVIMKNISLNKFFDMRILIFLPLIFLSLSFLGFFLGIMKIHSGFVYSLIALITTIIVLVIIYLTIAYFLNLILLLIVLGLGFLNYYLIKNYDI